MFRLNEEVKKVAFKTRGLRSVFWGYISVIWITQ
jgi:hypothetical protein